MPSDPTPEYMAAVAALGDPQPTIDALTAHLDAATPPTITTWVLRRAHTEAEPEGEDTCG